MITNSVTVVYVVCAKVDATAEIFATIGRGLKRFDAISLDAKS